MFNISRLKKWNVWKHNYKEVKGYFWTIFITYLICTSLVIKCIFNYGVNKVEELSSFTSKVLSFEDNDEEKDFEILFKEALEEYQTKNNFHFYESGKNCLYQACKKYKCKTKEEITKMIKYNERFFKK